MKNLIKDIRTQLHITQHEMSKLLDVRCNTIASYEAIKPRARPTWRGLCTLKNIIDENQLQIVIDEYLIDTDTLEEVATCEKNLNSTDSYERA